MIKNLDRPSLPGRRLPPGPPDPAQARRLRRHLTGFLHAQATGAVTVPTLPHEELPRAEGHFHLVPELFLQVAGHTRFRFPDATAGLGPGGALIVPPRLLHAEDIAPGEHGEPFCNLVIQSDGGALSCHLAHEVAPGRPGILHLEVRHHLQAGHILGWLAEAARLAREAAGGPAPWVQAQLRALVAAATAGVLQALDDAGPGQRPEPELVARARVLIQNQLGDHQLSVRRLAGQLGCTPDYLSHRFGQASGEHLAACISRQRMERAAHLLRETGLAGKQVAWACGFASQTYFIRSFRAHFGMTPRAWRTAHRSPAGGA